MLASARIWQQAHVSCGILDGMHLRSIEVRSYKSFEDSGRAELSPGMTVVVGRNSAGKSALLEQMTLSQANAPHRTPRTVPSRGDEPPPTRVAFELVCTGQDLDRAAAARGSFATVNVERLAAMFGEGERVVIQTLEYEPVIYGFENPTMKWINIRRPDPAHITAGPESGINNGLGTTIRNQFAEQIAFRFGSERYNVGHMNAAPSLGPRLQPDCRNLPDVLHDQFTRRDHVKSVFNTQLRRVFPDIYGTTALAHNGQIEIRVWPVPLETDRDDLSIPLNQCGTGVGQVVSMLCALLFSTGPRTFLIDEPSSFLHPGAARATIEILREQMNEREHQVVIATHSPEVISDAKPDAVVRVERSEGRSTASTVPPASAREQRQLMLDLGVRLSSVFGVDGILWVEGMTEQQCLTAIAEHSLAEKLRGRRIVAVADTGAFEEKRISQSIELYEKLSNNALAPAGMAYFFDRENRDPGRLERLREKSAARDRICFTERRMIENYFLHPGAIAALLRHYFAAYDVHREPPDEVEVATIIERYGREPALDGSEHEPNSQAWLAKVHGAKLLDQLCEELSDHTMVYEKIAHGQWLVAWLQEHDSSFLAPLASELARALDATALHGGAAAADG